eukprot:CAMPEP_0172615754 /NCGR_PEP_ID=MMETSP1068-20121228/62487_1 /TAXON_ID=35684 /ORGANISM="Pseudopedinella elastica, Strain CCMP716" /LENGTH=45 /DNA_ID= /DNA_START= /DNA_END= /DNA_ORIENTATION=
MSPRDVGLGWVKRQEEEGEWGSRHPWPIPEAAVAYPEGATRETSE